MRFQRSNGMQRIAVNIAGLKNIHDFGLNVFQGYLPTLNRMLPEIVFTGKNRVIFENFDFYEVIISWELDSNACT